MIKFLNSLIEGLANAVLSVLNLLPETPFNWDLGALGDFWNYVTYFIPFAEMVTLLGAYVGAVALWYVVRWLLRFVQYIQ